MDSLQKISNDLVNSMNEKEKKKSIPYDTYAKVIRIDGGTAWVHIPGGVDETPVALTVNAKVGDSVLVRVSGGNAWIVGNSSAPPTDDTKAVEAKDVADGAQETAESAQETAEGAEEIAKDASRAVKSTSQYFWHTETDTGAGAGAHITEVPQEDFLDDPANGGGNLLAQSGGVYIRDGVNVNAQFTPASLIIGDYTYSGNIYNSQFILDNSDGTSMITCRYWDSTNQQFNQGRSLMYWNGNRGQTLEFMSYDFDSSDEYDGELVIGQEDYGDTTTKGIGAQSYKYVPGTGYSGIELRIYPQSVKVRRIGTTSGGNKSRTDVAEIDTSGNIKAYGTIKSGNHATEIGYKTNRQTGTYSLATGTTFVTVPASALSRITLSEGTWIIQAHAAFERNANGRRAMRIYSVTESAGLSRSFVNQMATSEAATNMNTMAIVPVGSTDITYTVQLVQDSGSAKSVDLVLEAVRIA